MMDETERENINNGIVLPKYVKKCIHYFCDIVGHTNGTDVYQGAQDVYYRLMSFSKAQSNGSGIIPITHDDNLLCYFFNQKNEIPGYVYYWLERYHSCTMGYIKDYNKRNYEVRDKLQAVYISLYRRLKEDAIDMRRTDSAERRKLCKLYRSGKYAELFKLRNKDIESIVASFDFSEIETMIYLFYDIVSKDRRLIDDAAVLGFVLGMIQGRSQQS